MTMTPYNTDITRALKWMHNNAPNIQSIVQQKSNWYVQFQDQFWDQWEIDVFNLQTASPFGLMVWCIILGVPAALFGLYPENLSWAFGPNRQNFVYSGSDPTLPNPNLTGGNFYGGGNSTIVDLQEVRWALQLRYAALISNGRVQFINEMLNWIFNGGQPWNFATKNYIYLADSTTYGAAPVITSVSSNGSVVPGANYSTSSQKVTFTTAPVTSAALTWSGTWNGKTITNAPLGTGNGTTTVFGLTPNPSLGEVMPVTTAHYMEYRIGAGFAISPNFLNLLNSPQYGIVPTCGGTRYAFIQES